MVPNNTQPNEERVELIDLKRVKPSNAGTIQLIPSDLHTHAMPEILLMTTDPLQWSFSACLDLEFDAVCKEPLLLRVRIAVNQGTLGIGVLCKGSWTEYAQPEKILDATTRPIELNFVLTIPAETGQLIFRNCAVNGTVTIAELCSIELISIPKTSQSRLGSHLCQYNKPLIHHLASKDKWKGNLLCLSHTQRPFESQRGSRVAFLKRYERPDRLPPKIPFAELTHARNHSPWKGQITIWSVDPEFRTPPELLAHLQPTDCKPQQALWFKGQLWILSTELLEVYDASIKLLARIEDPWLAGAHTITPDQAGNLVVSCSASDALLFIDPERYLVTDAVRLPEALYGHNYPLSRQDSVVTNYIHNDLQLTHVNAAWPWRGGLLVSTLIQGAIGWFDCNRNYRELLRGYVGCHGIKVNASGSLYFCDSPSGKLIVLDENFKVNWELPTESRWLHDALELVPGLYALALADRNTVEFVQAETQTLLYRLDASPFGQGTQFLSYSQ